MRCRLVFQVAPAYLASLIVTLSSIPSFAECPLASALEMCLSERTSANNLLAGSAIQGWSTTKKLGDSLAGERKYGSSGFLSPTGLEFLILYTDFQKSYWENCSFNPFTKAAHDHGLHCSSDDFNSFDSALKQRNAGNISISEQNDGKVYLIESDNRWTKISITPISSDGKFEPNGEVNVWSETLYLK